MTAPRLAPIARMWSAPGREYDAFSRGFAAAADEVAARLDVDAGALVLDVACGTGLAARAVSAHLPGARVIGLDVASGLVSAARDLADPAAIAFAVADAEALPFADGAFDAVVSTFGVSFAPTPARAAVELARVTRRGGRLGIATWLDDEPTRRLAALVSDHIAGRAAANPPSDDPHGAAAQPSRSPPGPWASRAGVESLLGSAWTLAFDTGDAPFRAPSAEDAWDRITSQYGPMCAVARGLPPARRAALQHAVIVFYREFASADGISVPRRYLTVTGIRR